MRRLVVSAVRLLSPWRRQRLTRRQATTVLDRLYELVNDARWQAAALGREYFDTQWRSNVGEDPPEVWLSPYRRDWFEASMRSVRRQFEESGTPREVIAKTAEIAAKEVRNGSRRTVLRAVQENPRQVTRWARYDPQPPTCAFCLMLISRGAVYSSRKSAGGVDLWHPGCTCVAVPVFDSSSWDGRDQHLDAERLWRDATRGHSGAAAQRAFRRAVDERNRTTSRRDTAAAA